MQRPAFQRRLLIALAAAALAPPAWSQAYPGKPITLIVPYPAGAAVDRVGRALAVELGKRLGSSIVVENVPGASGTIGAKKVQRSPADGYTLLLGTVNEMLVAPAVLKSGYSSKDFTPIAKLSFNSTVLVAHPSLPANNVDELAALAKRAKEPLLSGATGSAMMQTIGGTLMADAAGFKIQHVVYKGGAPLLNDLLGGQVMVGTIALTSALPMVRDGKLKALGIISDRRDPTAPQIPTVNEGKAVKGVSADLWTGLFGPANLPAPIAARLEAAVREVLADAAYRDGEFKAGSIVAEAGDPQGFVKYLRQEEARLQPLLATIKAD
ncbi:MAG TPA: tripartite tricarboxylate transporter substrate binding protein [Burkholderiaceae bacterium]|nr:tripartite tricarboxylate transporter substrate binding protein [Burkholderiaceae bacterium]